MILLTKEELLELGIFHEDYSVLHPDYTNGIGLTLDRDLILIGSNNIVFEYVGKYILGSWYITGSELEYSSAFNDLAFEEVLDLATEEIKMKLLFHLDLFV